MSGKLPNSAVRAPIASACAKMEMVRPDKTMRSPEDRGHLSWASPNTATTA